jgi:hypothetical protein
MHTSDPKFGRRGGGGVSYIHVRKKLPERRSGLCLFEKELRNGVPSQNTPEY